MKVYRYMSLNEFYKLTNGLDLVNNADHSKKSRTVSEGFCFLPENVTFYSDVINAEEIVSPDVAFEFMKGIVCDDILVEMEIDQALLTESFGVYADPYSFDGYTILIKEYTLKKYNWNIAEVIRYAIKDHSLIGWKWYNYNQG